MENQAINSSNKWKYIPNILTIVRMVLAVAVALLLIIKPYTKQIGEISISTISNGRIYIYLSFVIAGVLFTIACITDFLDGFIARKKHLVSDFGKLWDPIADKVLIDSTLIILTYWQIVYVWITVLMITRDLIVDATRMIKAKEGKVVAANIWGKLKTVVQMVGLILVLLIFNQFSNIDKSKFYDPYWLGNFFLFFALFFSILSGCIYEYQMLKKEKKIVDNKK